MCDAPVADLIVVGGGAAGCVLAARLSEDSNRRVILIEAGPDTPPDRVPPDIRDPYPVSYANPRYFWKGLTARGVAGGSRTIAPFLQAKVMGGGSSVMGMWALRGVPDDYDGWERAGATGWGFNDVLPAFRRLERDLDFSGPLHGNDGPIPVRRIRQESFPGFALALRSACQRRGILARDDLNGDDADGFYAVPLANTEAGRVSSADGYLTDAVRHRSNLEIRSGTTVTSLRMNGAVVRGVILATGEEIAAKNVALCAGAIGTPAILLRSGIGPANEVAALGIRPVLDLRNVGKGLQNHCVINLATRIAPGARQTSLRTYGLACARVSSGVEGAPAGDLHLQFIAQTGSYAHGSRIGIVGAALYAPESRGSVTLSSREADAPPQIDFNLLGTSSDRLRMALALRLALGILRDPDVEAVRGAVFSARPTSFIRRLNRPSILNRLFSAAIATALDGPRQLRNAVTSRGGPIVSNLDPDSAAVDALLSRTVPVFHPTGTCRMGAADDTSAVVDPYTRVRGIAGLYVVDASIMPTIPRANTCLPAMMVAERAAELLRETL